MEKLPSYEEIMKNGKSVTNSNEGLPSYEEVMSANQEEPGTLHDILVGAGQGITLGFGDELLAALETGVKTATGKSKLEDMYDTYRKLQQQHETEVGQAHTRSPYASMTGELVGGLALPLGALGSVAKGAKLSERLLGAAKAGAAIGGISSAGGSKSNIENIPEYASDIASGTIGGGLIGGALGGVGEVAKQGIKYGKEYIAESPKLERLVTSYGLQKEGIDLGTKSGSNKVIGEAHDTVDKITDALTSGREAALNELSDTINKATEAKAPIHADQLRDLRKSLFKDIFKLPSSVKMVQSADDLVSTNEEAGKFLLKSHKDDINKIIDGSINPSELWTFKKELINSASTNENLVGNPRKNLFNFVNEKVEPAVLSVVPNAAELREAIKVTSQPIENLINGTTDKSIHLIKASEKSETQLRSMVKDSVLKQIKSLGGAGFQSMEERHEFGQQAPSISKMYNRIHGIGENDEIFRPIPMSQEIVDKLTPFIQEGSVSNAIEKQAKQIGALKANIGMQPNVDSETGNSLLGGINPMSITDTGLAQVGSMVGKGVNKLQWADKNILPVSKMVGAIPKTVNATADKFVSGLEKSSNPAMQRLAKTIRDSLDNQSNTAGPAAINTIMQSYSARKALGLTVGKSLDKQKENKEENR